MDNSAVNLYKTTYLDQTVYLDPTARHEKDFLEHSDPPTSPSILLDEKIYSLFVRQGFKCLDAGANIGFSAIQMLHYGANDVVSIEPHPILFERLILNLPSNAIAYLGALSSSPNLSNPQTKNIPLYESSAHNQGSTLDVEMINRFPHVFEDTPRQFYPKIIDIQIMHNLFGYFDFWKLDIEGQELKILRTAKNLLDSIHRPKIIYFEMYNKASLRSIKKLTENNNYLLIRTGLTQEGDFKIFEYEDNKDFFYECKKFKCPPMYLMVDKKYFFEVFSSIS